MSESEQKQQQQGKARDLTESAHASEADDPTQQDPVYQTTRRTIIRVGNLFFIMAGCLIFVPMLVGVTGGITNKRVWDPHTELLVYDDDEEERCVEDARRLLVDAGRQSGLAQRWSESYSAWQARCKAPHQDLYEALKRTRERLSKGQQP